MKRHFVLLVLVIVYSQHTNISLEKLRMYYGSGTVDRPA